MTTKSAKVRWFLAVNASPGCDSIEVVTFEPGAHQPKSSMLVWHVRAEAVVTATCAALLANGYDVELIRVGTDGREVRE